MKFISLISGISLSMIATTSVSETGPAKPAAIKPGDTIMFVAPAGELQRERIERAQKRLEAMGFHVIVPETLFRRRGYLAGTDQQRADELMAAFKNPEVKAIFPGTGGYGTTRLLDLLDYETINANPKILIGFSDITGLHLAFAKKCNFITFHTPVVQWGLGSPDGMSEFASEKLWRCLLVSENAGQEGFEYTPPDGEPLKKITGGKARGRLIGGNLSLVAATMGTPYEIETDGRVLFLEDVHEAPYRVDRMLSQLRHAGKLDKPAAVILGSFTDAGTEVDESTLSMDEVFDDYFAKASYPVIKNFPAGHQENNASLPIGAMFEVDADMLSVRVLENPVK